ncbi:MAG: hypothetical protein ACLGI6_24275, partial [Gammaproteobacteria bacterium]
MTTAVPLAAQRLRERGYNQAWEVARRVARLLGCPADARLLRRGQGRRAGRHAHRPERVGGLDPQPGALRRVPAGERPAEVAYLPVAERATGTDVLDHHVDERV